MKILFENIKFSDRQTLNFSRFEVVLSLNFSTLWSNRHTVIHTDTKNTASSSRKASLDYKRSDIWEKRTQKVQTDTQ